MSSTLDITRRIKSVKNTRQITRAMEKISAIKMRKSNIAVMKSRRYVSLAEEILQTISGRIEKHNHPLLKIREERRVGYLVISPDRGLCGGVPTKLLQEISSHATDGISSKNIQWYTMGKKLRDSLVRLGAHLEADFGAAPPAPHITQCATLIKMLVDDYTTGKIDVVYLAWTDFKNTLVQKAMIKKILPFEITESKKQENTPPFGHPSTEGNNTSLQATQYTCEPNSNEALDPLLIRILELQLYQAILESNASEHSARMVAMRNASENAGDLINDLTLEYNQVRQSGITREIAEISAGSM